MTVVSKSRKNRDTISKSRTRTRTNRSRITKPRIPLVISSPILQTIHETSDKLITEEEEVPITEQIRSIFGFYPDIDEDKYTIRDPKDKKCITLQIDTINKKIKIVIVNKCDLYSGKEALEKVIQLANRIHYKDIYLEDFSHLQFTGKYWGVGIKLAPLFIMIRGKSWYNGYGFVSDNYENELLANSQISSWKMGDLLTKIYPNGIPAIPPSLIKELHYSNDQSVGDFMSQFISYTGKIKKEDGTILSTNVIVKWVYNMIILCNQFIVYDNNLHYDPNFDPNLQR